jgi:hypothetical protein
VARLIIFKRKQGGFIFDKNKRENIGPEILTAEAMEIISRM